jgi:hypothetical protein
VGERARRYLLGWATCGHVRLRVESYGGLIALSSRTCRTGLSHEHHRFRKYAEQRWMRLTSGAPLVKLECVAGVNRLAYRTQVWPEDGRLMRSAEQIFVRVAAGSPRIGWRASGVLGVMRAGQKCALIVWGRKKGPGDFAASRFRCTLNKVAGVLGLPMLRVGASNVMAQVLGIAQGEPVCQEGIAACCE